MSSVDMAASLSSSKLESSTIVVAISRLRSPPLSCLISDGGSGFDSVFLGFCGTGFFSAMVVQGLIIDDGSGFDWVFLAKMGN